MNVERDTPLILNKIWKFIMSIRMMKKDPIAELTGEIKELKMRIYSLELQKNADVFVRPPEERTAVYAPVNNFEPKAESVFEEEDAPFLPKPKFGDLSLKKGVEATQSDFNDEAVVELKKRKR
jgi:hypothetical protein